MGIQGGPSGPVMVASIRSDRSARRVDKWDRRRGVTTGRADRKRMRDGKIGRTIASPCPIVKPKDRQCGGTKHAESFP